MCVYIYIDTLMHNFFLVIRRMSKYNVQIYQKFFRKLDNSLYKKIEIIDLKMKFIVVIYPFIYTK